MKTGDSVWLVGASSGIGASLAKLMLSKGHTVALSARNRQALDELAASSAGSAGRAVVHECDVTSEESVKNAYAAIRADIGVPDCVISNAGTYTPLDGSELTAEECRRVFDVNLYGSAVVVTAVLPEFLERGSGSLAAVASLSGYRGLPRAAAYGASKAGLIAFMESLRFDLEPRGLDVTVINPGFVKTPLTDKNTFKMPCLISPERAAEYIYNGLIKGRREIHFPPRFSWFMKTLRVLPYPLYAFLVGKINKDG